MGLANAPGVDVGALRAVGRASREGHPLPVGAVCGGGAHDDDALDDGDRRRSRRCRGGWQDRGQRRRGARIGRGGGWFRGGGWIRRRGRADWRRSRLSRRRRRLNRLAGSHGRRLGSGCCDGRGGRDGDRIDAVLSHDHRRATAARQEHGRRLHGEGGQGLGAAIQGAAGRGIRAGADSAHLGAGQHVGPVRGPTHPCNRLRVDDDRRRCRQHAARRWRAGRGSADRDGQRSHEERDERDRGQAGEREAGPAERRPGSPAAAVVRGSPAPPCAADFLIESE